MAGLPVKLGAKPLQVNKGSKVLAQGTYRQHSLSPSKEGGGSDSGIAHNRETNDALSRALQGMGWDERAGAEQLHDGGWHPNIAKIWPKQRSSMG